MVRIFPKHAFFKFCTLNTLAVNLVRWAALPGFFHLATLVLMETSEQTGWPGLLTYPQCMGEVEELSSLAQLDDSDNDSDTVCRLCELEIAAGSGRACNKRGRARNIMNQTALGTVSLHTLSYLLGRGAECLWAFPQHNDANSS